MATVFLAVQENLHREVALKVMTQGLSVDKVYCHRFLKEGRIAAQLAHQNLLTVYDIGVHEDDYYMASEYLPGGTVYDRLKEGMAEHDVVRVVTDIAQALEYAHSKGFVHRDVKPGNLLFRGSGECVLGDFGIAKSVDSTTNATKIGTSIGTPQYMSPEQAKGEKVDHRTDLYSLGIVFHQMLEGELPFDGPDPFNVALAQIGNPHPPLGESNSKFQGLVDRLLQKNRDERYDSAGAFLADLQQVTGRVPSTFKSTRRGQDAVTPRAETAVPQKKMREQVLERESSQSPLRAARYLALLLLLIAIGGAGWLAWTKGWFEKEPAAVIVDDVTNADEARVTQLLSAATEQIENGRLFVPAGANAYESYQQALRADPGNQLASDGVKALATIAASRIRTLLRDGDLDEAQKILNEASRRYPIDRALRELDSELERLQAQQRSTERTGTDTNAASGEVQTILTRADRFFDANQIIEAARDYKEVLRLDPSNDRATERLERIGDNWATAAERSLGFGDTERAARMVEKGLEAKPDHERLLQLREQIQSQ